MSTTPTPSSTPLELPPSLASMLAEEVKDWCKLNWSKIEVENITVVNLKSLIDHLGGSKSFKKKAEGVVNLLLLINEKKVPEESEKLEEKLEEEPEEESQVSRRKGWKHSALEKEEEEEKEEGEDKVLKEEEEVGVKGKEHVDVHPVKKVHITKRQPVLFLR